VEVPEFFMENFVIVEGKVALQHNDMNERLLDVMYDDLMKDVGESVADVFKRYLI